MGLMLEQHPARDKGRIRFGINDVRHSINHGGEVNKLAVEKKFQRVC